MRCVHGGRRKTNGSNGWLRASRVGAWLAMGLAVAAQAAGQPAASPKSAKTPAQSDSAKPQANGERGKSSTDDGKGSDSRASDAKVGDGPRKLADNLWIDTKRKQVLIDGVVVMRKGPPLELFACLKNTKEHESIVSVEVSAYMVHAALLAVGAKPGTPVQFDPVYKPATGPQIDIEVLWKDKSGKEHKAKAQDWVRDIKTKKAMTHPWVFAGSLFYVDPDTGKRHYLAEGGELICVSNFATATMDLPVESSQSTEGLLFEAFTENIPPEETPVRLVLTPRLDEKAAKESKAK